MYQTKPIVSISINYVIHNFLNYLLYKLNIESNTKKNNTCAETYVAYTKKNIIKYIKQTSNNITIYLSTE